MKIIEKEISHILHELPDIVPFQAARELDNKKESLFLCALGFEPRCLTIPREISEIVYRVGCVRYFTYSTNVDDNDANRPELEKHLQLISDSVESIRCDDQDFVTHLERVLDTVEAGHKSYTPTITFDISVASNKLILKAVGAILKRNVALRIVYSEANVYHPTKDEYKAIAERLKEDEAVGIEHGVSEVIPSKEQPGHHLDPLPNAVIIFPTFKASRSRAVIGMVDATLLTSPRKNVVWMIGEPHLENDNWRVDAMIQLNNVAPDAPQFRVKTFDYKETLCSLNKAYGQIWEHHNVSLAQFGSKFQALATAIFCYLNPEVRVWYAIPKRYNSSQYSDGCKATWMIDFGQMAELRKTLNSVGKLSLLP
jgi:hypothetical protein